MGSCLPRGTCLPSKVGRKHRRGGRPGISRGHPSGPALGKAGEGSAIVSGGGGWDGKEHVPRGTRTRSCGGRGSALAGLPPPSSGSAHEELPIAPQKSCEPAVAPQHGSKEPPSGTLSGSSACPGAAYHVAALATSSLGGLVQTIKDHVTKPTAMAHGRVAHLIEWKGWSAPQAGWELSPAEEECYTDLADELKEARFAAGVAEQFAISEAMLSTCSSLDGEGLHYRRLGKPLPAGELLLWSARQEWPPPSRQHPDLLSPQLYVSHSQWTLYSQWLEHPGRQLGEAPSPKWGAGELAQLPLAAAEQPLPPLRGQQLPLRGRSLLQLEALKSGGTPGLGGGSVRICVRPTNTKASKPAWPKPWIRLTLPGRLHLQQSVLQPSRQSTSPALMQPVAFWDKVPRPVRCW